MIVCVLGMHKSGTTLVAETLHHSGVHMADVPDDLGYDDSNKYERHEAQRINRVVLGPVLVPTWKGFRLRNAGLDRAGYQINLDSISWVRRGRLRRAVDEAPTEPIAAMVASLASDDEHWGFKDPRTCLTYQWWSRSLPDHRVVAVYRPFDEVMMRYKVKWTSPVRLLRVARTWIVHNELLLEHLARRSDFVLLRYDEFMTDDHELGRLRSYLGVPLTDRRRPDLYRARADSTGASPTVWLPPTLRRRAERVERQLDEVRRA